MVRKNPLIFSFFFTLPLPRPVLKWNLRYFDTPIYETFINYVSSKLGGGVHQNITKSHLKEGGTIKILRQFLIYIIIMNTILYKNCV